MSRRGARFVSFALCLMLGVSVSAYAIDPQEQMASPALEARARVIGAELRCLVCQNQSIDDSDAELAHDLRLLVRERLATGDTNAEVEAYLVRRYGDYILLQPPFLGRTYILWSAPLLFLILGFGIAYRFYRGTKNHWLDEGGVKSDEQSGRDHP